MSSTTMPIDLAFTIFVLAILCGIAVISKVPATLHTPLMSGRTPSRHVLVGAMIIAVGQQPISYYRLCRRGLPTLNVVGGYVVTDRMLQMFGRSLHGAQGRRRRD
jgi:NAD(P) transhydrogenase subunit alpha